MGKRRIDRVEIAGSLDAMSVTIPWASRGMMLVRLRQGGGADEVIRAFEAVGCSKPVLLDRPGKRRLLAACKLWLNEVGVDKLPEGIFELSNALEDEQANGDCDDDERLKSLPARADTDGAA
jgi:hypothetical protein